jgi:hypothetical protein
MCFGIFGYFATLWSIFSAMHGYPALFGGLGFVLGIISYGMTADGMPVKNSAMATPGVPSMLNFTVISMVTGMVLFLIEVNLPLKTARVILGIVASVLLVSSCVPYVLGKIRSPRSALRGHNT